MITLLIDGQKVMAQEGSTVLEVARAENIYIPSLCYHPDLSTFGGCRVCIVEINGRMVTACRALVEENMTVVTDSPYLTDLRKLLVEMVLLNHNPDCQSCVRNNDCDLQKVSAFVGITEERLSQLRRGISDVPADTSNPFFDLDYTRCILCGICVRTCAEINGSAA